ncbi:hypothetical protein IWQ48_001667 [Labrenzia sp. EL_13]|nr:hypothetical protein [Labrenzia sp. EL_13]
MNSKYKIFNSKRSLIIFTISALSLSCIPFAGIEAAESLCEGGETVVVPQVRSGVDQIYQGRYREFLLGVEVNFPILAEKRQAFLSPLEKYFPKGFQACRYLGINERSNLISDFIVQYYSPEGSVYLYMISLQTTAGIRGGVMQFHISTDFAEIFDLWK